MSRRGGGAGEEGRGAFSCFEGHGYVGVWVCAHEAMPCSLCGSRHDAAAPAGFAPHGVVSRRGVDARFSQQQQQQAQTTSVRPSSPRHTSAAARFAFLTFTGVGSPAEGAGAGAAAAAAAAAAAGAGAAAAAAAPAGFAPAAAAPAALAPAGLAPAAAAGGGAAAPAGLAGAPAPASAWLRRNSAATSAGVDAFGRPCLSSLPSCGAGGGRVSGSASDHTQSSRPHIKKRTAMSCFLRDAVGPSPQRRG